jgi:hypothetical protein
VDVYDLRRGSKESKIQGALGSEKQTCQTAGLFFRMQFTRLLLLVGGRLYASGVLSAVGAGVPERWPPPLPPTSAAIAVPM